MHEGKEDVEHNLGGQSWSQKLLQLDPWLTTYKLCHIWQTDEHTPTPTQVATLNFHSTRSLAEHDSMEFGTWIQMFQINLALRLHSVVYQRAQVCVTTTVW